MVVNGLGWDTLNAQFLRRLDLGTGESAQSNRDD